MTLIHKAIFVELSITFVISVIFLNITLMMEHLLRLTRLISGIGANISDMLWIVIYIQPQLLLMSMPMSVLLSCLMTYGRMQYDNEVIVLRSSGLPLRGMITPALYLGLAVLVLSIFTSFYFSPAGSAQLNKRLFEILTQKAAMAFEEGVFNTAFKNIVILVKNKLSANELEDIFILDDKIVNEQKIITAKSGIIKAVDNGINLKLNDGKVTITGQNTITQLSFASYTFTLYVSIHDAVKQTNEMSPFELYTYAQANPEKRLKLLVDLHRRLSLPAMCLLMSLIGPPVALFFKKTGRLGSLSIGLAIFAIYYTLLLYGEGLVKSEKLPHFIGSWIAFVCLSMATVWIYKKVSKD